MKPLTVSPVNNNGRLPTTHNEIPQPTPAQVTAIRSVCARYGVEDLLPMLGVT
jgi:hypothetical protein